MFSRSPRYIWVPRTVSLLEPEAVIEQTLAIALEGSPAAGVGDDHVDLPDLLVDLGSFESDAHVPLFLNGLLLEVDGREAKGLEARGNADLAIRN